MRFIDPKTDFAFKKIFGHESNKDILISFLNAFLKRSGEDLITEVTILDPYQHPSSNGLKSSILDVKCCDQKGIKYIVEMQVEKVKGFADRVLYNLAKSYSDQLLQGETYIKLNDVISLNILDFELFPNLKKYHSFHEMRETESNDSFFKGMKICVVELSKVNFQLLELKTTLDRWIYFFKEATNLELIPSEFQEPEIKKAFEIANEANLKKEEKALYEENLKRNRNAHGKILAAEEKGMEKGIQLMVKKLYDEKVDISFISKITGMTESQIIELITKIK